MVPSATCPAIPCRETAAALDRPPSAHDTRPEVLALRRSLTSTPARVRRVEPLAPRDDRTGGRQGFVWTFPAARMKAKREHRIPLCGRTLLRDSRQTASDEVTPEG